MTQSIFTGFSPNLEWDDALLAFSLLFQPWRWRKGKAVTLLEERISHDVGQKYAVAFESGRTSLAVLLQTSGLQAGDQVALQAYTCVAVPNAILWAGMQPLYIDCDPETVCMSPSDFEKKLTPQTKAVVVQYTFGEMGRLEEILSVARRNNLIVIEDCAHVIQGSYKGKPLGSWGDASFFSFGRDKAISGVFGGVAVTSNEQWSARLREKQTAYQSPSTHWIFQQLLHPVVTFKAKMLYDIFGLGKLIFFLARKFRFISKTVEIKERYGEKPGFAFHAMPNALALLALHQYKKVDRFNLHRKSVAAFYREKLWEQRRCCLLSEDLTVLPLRFLVQTEKAGEIIVAARKEKIYLGDWYREPIAPFGVEYDQISYTQGSCPEAEKIALRSLDLPTDIHIEKEERERVVQVVIAYLEHHI